MRILGLGLLVALFASAVGAGSALAKGFTPYTWAEFQHCPYENPEINDCFYGRTSGGATGGSFQYGSVLVKLTKPIVIQGAYIGAGPETKAVAPTDGSAMLESPLEPIVKGLKVITPKIQNKAKWPEALKASFNEALKNHEGKAFVKVEMAGNECVTVPGCLNTESLLFEEETPPAFRLPLKVTVSNSWLEKLGGGPCQIGSDEFPIKQNLNTAGAGRAGEPEFNEPAYTVTEVKNSQLVDVHWHIPRVSGAKGCGGEYESYVDLALNYALEVEYLNLKEEPVEVGNRTGVTILTGSLWDGASSAVVEEHEKGNPELP